MRLIDADALWEHHCESCNAEVREGCKTDPVCATLMWVDEAPTIDPVKHGYVPIEVVRQIQWERDIAMSYLEEAGIGFGEKAELQRVKHGKWIHDGKRIKGGVDWWHCSECLATESGVYVEKPYCPNCGARMDGE